MTATAEVADPSSTEMADSPMHEKSLVVVPPLESPVHVVADATLVVSSPSGQGGLGDSFLEGTSVIVEGVPLPPTSPLDDITSLFISARYGEFGSILSKLFEDPSKWDMVLTARDNEGHSILHWAALFDASDFVKASCNHVADISGWVNLRSRNGQTPAMWCCIKGNLQTLKLLYKQFGADISGYDSLKADCVILATQHHQHNTLLLLQKWLKPVGGRHVLEWADVSGCSAAHWAAYKGDILMLRLFAYFNTDMNAVDNQGMTPLHRAVSEGQNDCALFLVEKCDADVNLKNHSKQESALDIAKRLDNKILLFALAETSAKKEFGSSAEAPLGSKWSLPIIFSVCMSITMITFLTYFSRSGNLFLNISFLVVAIIANTLYVNLLFSDPGFVPRRKPGESAVEELQEKLESATSSSDVGISKLCVTCWETKEVERRMKHCSVCDRCVDAFDHHCGWINNCVAEQNHRRFVLMVASVFIGMIIFSIIWLNYAFNSGLSWLNLLWTRPLLVPAAIIHIMVVPWLGILCFMQFRSIALNLNTNEMINMHRYAHFWEHQESSSQECGGGKPCKKKFVNPFDQGGLVENCKYFWFNKGGIKKHYDPVPNKEIGGKYNDPVEVEMAKMV
jgi:ankyrin repeat protein